MKRRTKIKKRNIFGFDIGGGLNRMMGIPRCIPNNSLNFNNIIRRNSNPINYSRIRPTNFNKLFNLRDSDRDGVANVFDCQPYNRRYQDVKPNRMMMQRLEKLPIFVTDRPFTLESPARKFHHIKERKAAKEPKKRFYSIIKKYPQVVGEIERKKPRAVIITTAREEDEEGVAQPTIYGAAGKGLEAGEGVAIVRVPNIPYVKKKEKKYTMEERAEGAGTTVHELEHIRQFKSWKGKEKLQKKMAKGRYEQRREEVLAMEKERELHRERPEIQMKRIEKYAEEHPHSKIKKIKEWRKAYERYKAKKEEEKLRGFRETFKEE